MKGLVKWLGILTVVLGLTFSPGHVQDYADSPTGEVSTQNDPGDAGIG